MITSNQLRSAARFGTPLSKETLLELAEELEKLQRCDAPRKHQFNKPVLVATAGNVGTDMVSCKHCEFIMYHPRNLEVG